MGKIAEIGRPYHRSNGRRFLLSDRYDFGELFDRPVFKKLSPEWKLTISNKNTHVQMGGRGKPLYFPTVRENGRAKVSWLEKHYLNLHSQPWEFIEALPRTDLSGEDKKELYLMIGLPGQIQQLYWGMLVRAVCIVHSLILMWMR